MLDESDHGKILFSGPDTETNVVTKAVNAPLQQRTTVLNSDLRQASTFPSDYETDLESEWSKFSMIVFRSFLVSSCSMIFIRDVDWTDDSTSMTIEQRRNLFYQQRLARQVSRQMNELTSLLTKALIIHLNIGQQFNMTTPAMFTSLETLSTDALMDNARVRLPTVLHRSLNGTERVLLRVRFFFLSLELKVTMSVLVHLRTFGCLWSIEYESLQIDLVDPTRSRWK